MSGINKRRRQVIATSSWLALGLALTSGQVAMAQEAAASDNTVSEVVVTGTRASLQSAINRKRAATTTVDSIVAEDIAQFPDKNIGEALQRVTGVSLTRDFGEGSQISIRGVEPDLNRVEINGMSVLANAGTGNRGANFQELASELVASIDVFKGFTADMTEGGVGGTVSVRTRKPLDLRKPLLVVTGAGQHLDTQGDTTFRGNITAGRTFWDNRFGVLVNLTYNDINTRGDFLRNTLWTRFNVPANESASGDYDNSPEKTYVDQNFANITRKQDCPVVTTGNNTCLNQWNEYVPAIPRYGIWERSDKRISAQATLEYRVSDNLRTYVEYQINDRDQHLTDYDFQLQSDAQSRINAVTYGRNGQVFNQYPGVTRPVVVDAEHNLIDFYIAPYANTPAAGAVANAGSAGAFRTTNRDFDYALRSQYLQVGFAWKSDHLIIDGFAGTSEATNVDDTNFLQFLSSIPDIRVSLSPTTGAPTFTAPAGYDFNDPESLARPARDVNGNIVSTTTLNSQYQPKETDATEDTAKLDVDWLIDDGFFNKVEVGYQYRNSTTVRYAPNGYITFDPADATRAPIYVQGAFVNYNINQAATATGPTYNFNVPGNTAAAVTATQTATNAQILEYMRATNKMTPGTFFDGPNPGIAIPTNWYSPDATRIGESGLIDTSLYNHDLVRRSVGRNAAGQVIGEFDQAPDRDLEEISHAVYGQVNFQGDIFGMTLRGNTGVRIIQYEVNATGAITEQLRPAPGSTALTPGRVRVTTINEKQIDALPTFNASLNVTDGLVVRVGYAKVLARPKVLDLVPSGSCIFNQFESVDGSDAESCSVGNPALAPYRASTYDLGVEYYLNRDTLLSAALFYKDVETFTLARQLVSNYDLFNDGNLVNATIPINGQGAKQKGIEISAQTAFTWLPAPFDGLGVQANYTYATADNVGLFDSLTGEELPFANQSRDTYNLIVYYDKGPINARLAYNSRTPYLTGAGSGGGLVSYREGTGYLDGKITYEFNDHLSVFAEGQNLTGEYETAYATSLVRSNQIEYAGKRFFVGATYKY